MEPWRRPFGAVSFLVRNRVGLSHVIGSHRAGYDPGRPNYGWRRGPERVVMDSLSRC